MGSSKLSLGLKCCACSFLAGSPWWWTVLTSNKCVILIYEHWLCSNKLLAGQVPQNSASIHHLPTSCDRQVPTNQIDDALSIRAGCMWRKWYVSVHSMRQLTTAKFSRGPQKHDNQKERWTTKTEVFLKSIYVKTQKVFANDKPVCALYMVWLSQGVAPMTDIFQPFTRWNWNYCRLKENTTGNRRINVRLRRVRKKTVAVEKQ